MLEGACIGDLVDCYSVDKIIIGRNATISQYSFLCTASHAFNDDQIKSVHAMPLLTAPIVVCDYAWIAADAFIGPGVTIGDGAVAAARSTVVRDVEPWTIVAGNPAKIIAKRKTRLAKSAKVVNP